MKISNKEKIMLCILGIILIGFGYYNFIYSVQITKIEEKLKQESEIKQKYDTAMNTIKSMDDKKSDVKILKAKINEETVPFYPIISEEHIIWELDTLLKDSGLEGGIKFQPIASDSVEGVDKKIKTLAESSLQGIVDKYNNKETSSKTNDQTSTTKSTKNSKTNSSDSTDKNSSSSNTSKDKKKNTVHYVKLQVDFEGSYEGLDKFLNAIGQSKRKIVVNSIKLSSDTEKGMKGTIFIEIYSVPKLNDELEEYLKWDFNNTYGKSVPFSAESASSQLSGAKVRVPFSTKTSNVTSNTGAATVQEKKESGDFIASVKSITSDLPTIMMGKANDDLRTTYVYADSNSEEKVEMVLTQDGDKYYYKYKTSKGTFPTNYNGLGAEFVSTSKNIVLDILSESRVNSDDNSAIRLKIVNKTDKSVDVNISGDDSSNPRVIVDSDGNNISVNKN